MFYLCGTCRSPSRLPQYHDMGLIASYLGALYSGGTGVYQSPAAFLKNPVLWLQIISRFRGTHTQAPNFAYALAVRKFKALKKPLDPPLDLSCIKHMVNAAEPLEEKVPSLFKSDSLLLQLL